VNKAELARYIKDRHAFRREQIILPSGKRLGEVEEYWQTESVFGPLDAKDEVGRPQFSLLYFELGRGHAKTATLAAEALTSAFLDGDVKVYFSAADQDQAAIAFDMLTGFIRRNPALRPSFKILKRSIEVPATGATIRVLSSDAPSTYGLGGLSQKLLILCDELWTWAGRDLWDALWSATPKAENWRVIVASNAGFDTSSIAWELREMCRTEADPRFHLYSPDGVVASWISEQDLETQRRSLPPEVFQRLWENRWTEGSGSLITRQQLSACIDEDWRQQTAGQQSVRYFVGLDLGLVRDRTARAVVHVELDGRIVLDDLRVWQGSRRQPVQIADIENDLIEVSKSFNMPRIFCDPWQLQGSVQRLRGQVNVQEFKFTSESVRKLSENLLRLVRDAQLRLYPDTDLEHELLGLQMVQTTSGFRIDHRSGGFSDRAMALAMAALAATESPTTSAADLEGIRTLMHNLANRGPFRSTFEQVAGTAGLPRTGYDRLNG
jgi:phage terminase large subunit-like protein